MKTLLCAAALVVLVASGGAVAQDAAPQFLPPDVIDLAAILPPPPSQTSEVTKAEIAEIHQAQSAASPGEKAQAVKDSTGRRGDADELVHGCAGSANET